MQFDARAAKALEPGNHITFQKYPGLRFVASATRRTWIYRYKSPIDDRMRQVALGHWPAVSFPAAIVSWEDMRARRDAGGDPALDAKQARADEKAKAIERQAQQSADAYTVRVLCDEYLIGHVERNRCKASGQDVRGLFERRLVDIADLPVSAITRAIAFDLISGYAATAPVQASRLRCELGAAWDYAMDAGRLSESTVNWWRLILRGKIRSKGKTQNGENVGSDKRVLTEAEVGQLVAWLPNFPSPTADALTLYLWTGARGAEIVAMTGAEISSEGDQVWWTVPKAKTKNARNSKATDHRVPLFGLAKAVVLRRKQRYGDGFLFPSRYKSGHIDQRVVAVRVYVAQPYNKTAGLENVAKLPVTHWAPHDLRRTARTFLAKLGCPDAVGECILGHVLPGVVGTYNRHQYDDEKVEWLERLSDYLEIICIVR